MEDEKVKNDDCSGEPDPLWSHATNNKTPFGVGDSKDLASWIGRVIHGYSAIEFQFFLNFACCSNEDSKTSYQRFYSARQINLKQELAAQACSRFPEEFQEANKRLWRHLRAAADRRRQFAHSTITRDDNGFISIFPGHHTVRFIRLNHNLFQKTVSQFRTLQTDAHMLFAFHRMMNPHQVQQRVEELPLPRHTRIQPQDMVDPGPLSQRAEAAQNASLKRLALDRVLIVGSSLYPRSNLHPFRYNDHLVLWANKR